MVNHIMDEDDYEFVSRLQNPVPAQDTSTIPVTIGLDVLKALYDMAKPANRGDELMLIIAYNSIMSVKHDGIKGCSTCGAIEPQLS